MENYATVNYAHILEHFDREASWTVEFDIGIFFERLKSAPSESR